MSTRENIRLIARAPLANCVHDKSCRVKFAPISPKGLNVVAQTDFCVHR